MTNRSISQRGLLGDRDVKRGCAGRPVRRGPVAVDPHVRSAGRMQPVAVHDGRQRQRPVAGVVEQHDDRVAVARIAWPSPNAPCVTLTAGGNGLRSGGRTVLAFGAVALVVWLLRWSVLV